ncbi:MAG: hypothetical protein HY329_17830, partial [Chloroflexi bacterium]|nr:hypothetical protein [Chloroflexota bacterium]
PLVDRHKGVLLVNPGSPTLPRGLTGLPGTIAILDLDVGQATARLIQLQHLLPTAPRTP